MTETLFGSLDTPKKIKIFLVILSVSMLLTICGISDYFTTNPFQLRYFFLWMLVVLSSIDIIKLSRRLLDMKKA